MGSGPNWDTSTPWLASHARSALRRSRTALFSADSLDWVMSRDCHEIPPSSRQVPVLAGKVAVKGLPLLPPGTGYGHPLLHADCTAAPPPPLHSARARCRRARGGGPPRARGRRGRRPGVGPPRPWAPPPAGRGFCRRSGAGPPPSFPAEAAALVVNVPPFFRA